MKKDKKWAMNQVNNLDGVRVKGKFTDFTTVPKDKAIRIISDMDEPETLTPKWIDDNSVYASSDGVTEEYVHVDELKELLVPKQELPVIPQFVAEWIDFKKKSLRSYENVFQAMDELVKSRTSKAHEWVLKTHENKDTFARAWMDGFTVEEQDYFAKIKGHENISSDDKYWNYCITDESLDIGDNKVHPNVLAEYVLSATKDEWENLGINDDNADFVEVEELEE